MLFAWSIKLSSIGGAARFISFAVVTASLAACGSGANSAATAAVLSISIGDFYAQLRALPDSGEGSLSERYDLLGRMSIPQYFDYLAQSAAAVDLHLGPYSLPDQRAMLLKNKPAFTMAAASFATVAAWWEEAGLRPAALGSEQDFSEQLAAAFSKTSMGLVSASRTSIPAGSCPIPLGIANTNPVIPSSRPQRYTGRTPIAINQAVATESAPVTPPALIRPSAAAAYTPQGGYAASIARQPGGLSDSYYRDPEGFYWVAEGNSSAFVPLPDPANPINQAHEVYTTGALGDTFIMKPGGCY